MPRPKISSEEKSPSASQDESGGATTADPMLDLLAMMAKKLEEIEMEFDKKFEEINKRFADQDKRIEDLRQERKSGDDNPLVAASGGAIPAGIKHHHRAIGSRYHNLFYPKSNLRYVTQEQV